MGIVFDVVRQTVVDDVRQVVNVQTASSHVGSHQELDGMLAELLHGQVALLLRQVAMQRLGIVAVTYQLVGHLLRLQLGAAEDDGEDAGVVVHETLQGQILVLGVHHVIDVVDVLSTLVSASHHNLLVIVQIALGDALYLAAHGSREEQRVAVFRHTFQDLVNALRESHIQHLVGLVQHHVAHVVKHRHASFHQVDKTSWRSNNNLYTLAQGTYLLLDAGTAIDGLDVDAVQVFGKVAHVVSNLQTQFTRRRQDKGMGQSPANLA